MSESNNSMRFVVKISEKNGMPYIVMGEGKDTRVIFAGHAVTLMENVETLANLATYYEPKEARVNGNSIAPKGSPTGNSAPKKTKKTRKTA